MTIDKAHRTRDGFLRVTAKGARSGIQTYLGSEIDPEGKRFRADEAVNVFRPYEEVFARDTLASFVGRPITDDHPSVAVTSKNWRDHSRGVIGGTVADGEWIRFDLAFMDAALIDKIDAGKRELSCGYDCALTFEDGVAPDGTAFRAVQRQIHGNHIAVVDRARAGSDARIRDGGNGLFAACDTTPNILNLLEDREPTKMPHTLTIDGLQVPNVSDEAKAAIEKLQGMIATATTAKDAADAQIATLTTDKATLDAKVITLEKQITDAALTPAKLQDAARAYQAVVSKAKALGVAVTDAMDEPAIRKAVVAAKVGDAAEGWTDAQIAASFDTLTADVNATSPVVNIGAPVNAADANREIAAARAAWLADKANSHRTAA